MHANELSNSSSSFDPLHREMSVSLSWSASNGQESNFGLIKLWSFGASRANLFMELPQSIWITFVFSPASSNPIFCNTIFGLKYFKL